MQYLKKYFTEGLIQMAILLSLSGMRVDVGLETYLPPSWHEMILGPSSALTQTQFHNLRNRLEDGNGVHLKNVDLDRFFTTQRLLGWVHSLDRLQVPHAELETWLVHREQDPLPVGFPDQTSAIERASPGMERGQVAPSVESRPSLDTPQEEEEDDQEVPFHSHCVAEHIEKTWTSLLSSHLLSPFSFPLCFQTSFSLQECLRLRTQHFYSFLSVAGENIIPTRDSSWDLELHWQDLLAIMEPQVPPDHTDLLAENPSRDFYLELNAEDNSNTLNINLLTEDLIDPMEGSPCPYPENLPSFDAILCLHDSTTSSFTPFPEQYVMNQDPLASPSDVFLFDEDAEEEDGLPSTINDLIENVTILDEIRSLNLSLEEGFSPEMVARLDEEDSDSGLSLDFSHSHASPCASEASSYSSSSSSCVSAEESPFSEDVDEDGVEPLVGQDLEMDVTIKQEEDEEEELGAVGGRYPEDFKQIFPCNYGDDTLFNGFPWLEHIGHDHTYNQRWSSSSSPSLGKMPTKPPKSFLRQDNAKPYHHSSSRHISDATMWSRDERRARALKVPFSNELIVNLPVEEFNDLLASVPLSEEQLSLVRDIRRRGKNKIAAQNCRKRKMDVLFGLSDDVSSLMRYRSRLLREKREALRNLQEMKRKLTMLYQDVFSRLRDEEGRPLNPMEYLLHFEANGSVTVASCKQGAALPLTKSSKKQRDKKK
uniref:Endoplasmic reticulum membrane sensor NFE2L1 n=1 Tax=Mola mola TaxID=94237 RepID=A0A3Q4AQK3_MOLML